ncbi:hypothetical protein JYM85_11745 [Salmonella enterica subsp. enterica serovar Javiana]|nr:hypothetical protein JYM85_11745 [Salmonella enterica subsp. enterica serovar Javiana]
MDSYGILSALAERTITAEEAKTMTLAARSSSAQVNEASLALLLIDNTLDAIKAAASEGKGYTLLPSYEISVKAIDLAEEFLRKQCGYVIDNQNGVRTVYWLYDNPGQ